MKRVREGDIIRVGGQKVRIGKVQGRSVTIDIQQPDDDSLSTDQKMIEKPSSDD